jgi:CelD/BcsL family acetyltransferase involved in cellulose biosynthesis
VRRSSIEKKGLNVELIVYRDESGFVTLRDEWDALLGRSRFDTIFLTWEWQSTWWRHLGVQRGPLYLLAAREADRLIGILPLYLSESSGIQSLTIVGCVEVSDYLDLIIEAGQEDTVYRALLSWLTGPEAPAWDTLELCNSPAASLAHTRLAELARARDFPVEVTQEDVCPVITLPQPGDGEDGWELYLAALDKKERHEIRRKLRRIEREAPTAALRIVYGGAEMTEAMESFIALHRLSRPDKHAFMTEEMQAYFRAVAAVLAERGWLQLSFLDIEDRPAASYFCFDYHGDILVYNSGYDATASPHLSPGWVLLAQLIQLAITEGRTRFDFLQGNEDYKYRFGGVDEPVHRMVIRRA